MARRTLQEIAREIPVTDYVDYRDYLAELYRRAKEVTSPYSYEAFAQDLGFSAINSLRLVIVRQRLLADKSAQTVARTLGLHRESRKYFLALVGHVNARTPKAKARYFGKMLAAKHESIVPHREKEQLAFLSEWYHWVVLEALRLEGARPDPAWLAERLHPQIGVERIRRSLALLESIGLVTFEDGEARLVSESPTLVPTDATAGHLAMTRHHQAMCEVARDAVTAVPEEEREFDALTISVSAESFALIAERLRSLCAEILEIESRPQPRQRVAQVNLSLFALTKPEAAEEPEEPARPEKESA